MSDMKWLATRLCQQAPNCKISFGEDWLRVQSACGEVRAAGDRVLFLNEEYRNLRMADDASLYNAVERFTQCLQAGGVEKDRTEEDRRACNPTYRKTAQALDRVNRRGLFAIAAAEAVLLTALFFTGQSFLVIAMVLVLAAAVTWLMDRAAAFSRNTGSVPTAREICLMC